MSMNTAEQQTIWRIIPHVLKDNECVLSPEKSIPWIKDRNKTSIQVSPMFSPFYLFSGVNKSAIATLRMALLKSGNTAGGNVRGLGGKGTSGGHGEESIKVCVCVCVRARASGQGHDVKSRRVSQFAFRPRTDSWCVCVCVCACESSPLVAVGGERQTLMHAMSFFHQRSPPGFPPLLCVLQYLGIQTIYSESLRWDCRF